MRTQWPDVWVTTYVFVFTCGAITLTAALHHARQPEHGLRSWGVAVTSAGAFAAIVLVIMGARGTSWVRLWEGVVGTPLQHPTIFYMPWTWLAGTRELAFVLPLVAAAYYLHGKAAWMPKAIALLRIMAGIWFFAHAPLFFSEATSLQEFCFNYGPSLAWLMAVPLVATPMNALGRARLWLAWVFIWQTLQAYPVAGSQIGWGSFLWVPMFIVGWHEAVIFWAERFQPMTSKLRRLGGIVVAATGMVALWHIASIGYGRFMQNEPLGLPGAARLRLQSDLTSDLRILDQNIRAHSGTVFTFPGMLSFNIWSGQHPLMAARPEAVIEQLEADPRAVVVMNDTHIHRLMSQGASSSGIMSQYLTGHL